MNNPVTHEDIISLKKSIDELTETIKSNGIVDIDLSVGKPIKELTESISCLQGELREMAK